MIRGCQVAVIGGGIVGLASAMSLARDYRASVVVVEAEQRLASHQTGHNSGVIHSGLYYRPGSFKARLCTEGREELYRFCQLQGIPHERCGKVVVAVSREELPALEELERRGAANGLAGLRRLSPEQIHDHEPHVAGIAALLVPQTGIVDYARVALGFAEVIHSFGGRIFTAARLYQVLLRRGELVLRTTRGEIPCQVLVNCAGLYSDRVAELCGLRPRTRIMPFRGEYYRLRGSSGRLCRNLIYPVPDPAFPFLGVHLTRMINGGVEAGPNAVPALGREGYCWGQVSLRDCLETWTFPGFWRMARRYWRTGLGEIWRSVNPGAFLRALQRLVPELSAGDLMPGGAGVRAQALDAEGRLLDDFVIVTAPRMVHVLNAPSPAATASISIGRHIARQTAELLGLSRCSLSC